MLLVQHLAGLQECPRGRHVPGLVEIDLARGLDADQEDAERNREDQRARKRESARAEVWQAQAGQAQGPALRLPHAAALRSRACPPDRPRKSPLRLFVLILLVASYQWPDIVPAHGAMKLHGGPPVTSARTDKDIQKDRGSCALGRRPLGRPIGGVSARARQRSVVPGQARRDWPSRDGPALQRAEPRLRRRRTASRSGSPGRRLLGRCWARRLSAMLGSTPKCWRSA